MYLKKRMINKLHGSGVKGGGRGGREEKGTEGGEIEGVERERERERESESERKKERKKERKGKREGEGEGDGNIIVILVVHVHACTLILST